MRIATNYEFWLQQLNDWGRVGLALFIFGGLLLPVIVSIYRRIRWYLAIRK